MNERTKELKSNALADWLEAKLEDSSQWIKPLLIAVVVLFVLVLTVMFLRSRSEAKLANMWEDYLEAGSDNAALLAVAKKNQGTVVGLWAQTTRAANDLRSAAQTMHTDRLQAQEQVDSAIEDLQAVVDATSGRKGDGLRAQALFGLGQAYELNFDVDKAREYYQMLMDEGGSGSEAMVEFATQRLQMLDSDEIKQFYTWYSNQTPGFGRSPGTPPGVMPPVSDAPDLPQDLSILPSFPNLSVPQPPEAEAETTEPGTEPESTTPETSQTPADNGAAEPTDDATSKDKPDTTDDSTTEENVKDKAADAPSDSAPDDADTPKADPETEE